jgi:hypothetical protein
VVGRNASAGTDLKLNAEILSYSRSKGIFAGVSLDGAVMQADKAERSLTFSKGDKKVEDGLLGRGIMSNLQRARLTKISARSIASRSARNCPSAKRRCDTQVTESLGGSENFEVRCKMTLDDFPKSLTKSNRPRISRLGKPTSNG